MGLSMPLTAASSPLPIFGTSVIRWAMCFLLKGGPIPRFLRWCWASWHSCRWQRYLFCGGFCRWGGQLRSTIYSTSPLGACWFICCCWLPISYGDRSVCWWCLALYRRCCCIGRAGAHWRRIAFIKYYPGAWGVYFLGRRDGHFLAAYGAGLLGFYGLLLAALLGLWNPHTRCRRRGSSTRCRPGDGRVLGGAGE